MTDNQPDERGVLHRHDDGTEHQHFSSGFSIGSQVIPDDDGSGPHQHGTLTITEDDPDAT